MITVNISRIHKIIQDKTVQYNSIVRNEISSGLNKYVHTFKIFEKTTNEDLENFIKEVDESRKKMINRLNEGMDIIEYIEYLKLKLEVLNSGTGINELLHKVKFLNKRAEFYTRILNDIKLRSNSDNFKRNFMDVDYYKSSFTEMNKSYDLQITTYIAENVEFLEESIVKFNKEISELNDEIAMKNQTTTTEIMDFEEFINA